MELQKVITQAIKEVLGYISEEEEVLGNEEGVCPICKSEDLDYFLIEVQGEDYAVFYPVICNNCGAEGEEWYDLKFTEMVMKKLEKK